MTNRIERLAGYVPEPTLQRAALAWLDRAERPATLREVAQGLGLEPARLTSVLRRLSEKGVVERMRVQMTYPTVNPRKSLTRWVWLYQTAREDSDQA